MNNNIKKCRYSRCNHPSRDIRIDIDDYVANGSAYFHKDCYEFKQDEESVKRCFYSHCKHESKEIVTRKEPYKEAKGRYYHEDCYRAKIKCEWKDAQTKKDLQLIKDLWTEHISNTVIYSELVSIMNNFIERGVPSDYLVFALEYIIQHNMNLHYPRGFKYYVDRQEIKEAYAKSKLTKMKDSDFSVKDDNFETPSEIQKTAVLQNQHKGFESILKT